MCRFYFVCIIRLNGIKRPYPSMKDFILFLRFVVGLAVLLILFLGLVYKSKVAMTNVVQIAYVFVTSWKDEDI